MELHSVQITVHIQQVKLNVRFPGQLSFQFKNSQLYHDMSKRFPITNGVCQVNDKATFELECPYTVATEKYNETSVDLTVSINTASGKIVAGVVSFDPFQCKVVSLPLKRCSDKAAIISMTVSFEKLNKVKDIQQQKIRALKQSYSPQRSSRVEFVIPRQRGSSKSNSKSSSSHIKKVTSKGKALNFSSRIKEIEDSSDRRLKIVAQEKDQMEQQLDRARQKWRLAERRQKQLQSTIRELKDSNQKKRIKIVELQNKQIQNEKEVDEFERKNKALYLSSKDYKQKISQLQSKILSLQKKNEVREQTANERQKRSTDKIHQLEEQNKKILKDYNALLEKMENQEINSQNAFRIKQKAHIEEKMKLKEDLDKANIQLQKFKQLLQDVQSRSSSLSQHQIKLTEKISKLEVELDKSLSVIEAQNIAQQRNTFAQQQLQNDLKLMKQLQQQKMALKKKYNEQVTQTQKMKDKLGKMTLQNQELTANLSTSSSQIEEARKEKKFFLSKVSDLQKTNISHQKQIARLQAENNSLASKNTYLNERLNDIKTKMQQKDVDYEQNQMNFTSKISSVIQAKSYLEHDIEDLRWNLEKEKENAEQYERKLKDKNDQLLAKEEELINLQKDISQSRMKINEYEANIEVFKADINDLKKKDNENAELLKQKDRKIYEQSKKIAQIQQQNFINLSKLKKETVQSDETIESMTNRIKQLTQELEKNITALFDLQRQDDELSQNHQELQRKYQRQALALEQAQKQNKQSMSHNIELKKECDKLKKQLESYEFNMTNNEQENNKTIVSLKQQLQQSLKNIKSKETDLETYQKAFKQLILILASDQQNDEDIVAVPDQNLAKNQLEALMARNKNLKKLNQKILELGVQINYLEKEKENKDNNFYSREELHDKKMKQYKEQMAELEKQRQEERIEAGKKYEKLEKQFNGLRTEKQKAESKIQRLEDVFAEERNSLKESQNEHEKSRDRIRELQAKLFQQREKSISSKSQSDTYVSNLQTKFEQQLDTYREKLNSIQQEKQGIEKNLAEREKNVTSLKSQVSELQLEKEKLKEDLSVEKNKHQKKSQQLKNKQQILKEEKRNSAELLENIVSLESELSHERQINKTLQENLKTIQAEQETLEIEKAKLTNQLKSAQENSTLSNDEYRTKIQTLEEKLDEKSSKVRDYHKKVTSMTNEIQMNNFEIKQLQQKLKDITNIKNDLEQQNDKKRDTIVKHESVIEDLKAAILKLEKEKAELILQKGVLDDEIDQMNMKMIQYESELGTLNQKLDEASHKLKQQSSKFQSSDEEKLSLKNQNSEIRQALTLAKRELQKANNKEAEVRSRLATVEAQLKQKEQFYQDYKSKNWQQNQKTIQNLTKKYEKLEDKLKKTQDKHEEEINNLNRYLQDLNKEKEQLEIMIEERDQLIESQEDEIVSNQNRIISLNAELRNCLEAWQKEKTAALPSRRQVHKIEEDLNKFQQYANDLEKKTKQTLRGIGSKAKDEILAKMGQQLVDLLDLQNRSKLRVLSFVSNQQKITAMREYDSMREKLQQLLKCQKGIFITNDST